MSKSSFLEHINDKNHEEKKPDSFQKESFVAVKRSYTLPLVIILLLMAGMMSVLFFMSPSIEMTDLTGITLEEARLWALDQSLTISSSEVYSDLEVGRIVSQSISPGTSLDKNDMIKVKISKGLDPYDLIDLPAFDASWSQSAIINWLNQNAIENYSFIEEVSNVQEGFLVRYRVIATNEAEFNRSSDIEFVISQVVDTASVEIPDFINMTLTDLDIWASTENIQYEYAYEVNNLYDADKIFYQSVAADQNMNSEEILMVKVSLGSDYESVKMTNLMNQSLSSAEAWLKNNRITYKLQYVYSDLYNENIVIDQSVYENTMVSDQVVLTVSKGSGYEMPDFSSLNIREAERLLSQYNNIEIYEVYHENEAGRFISQSTSAGQLVASDDVITVYYSLGNTVDIIDYRRQALVDLKEWVYEQNLNGANIDLVVKDTLSNELDYGLIINQSILNESIPLNSTLTVEVSTGLVVPDFSLLSLDQAQKLAEESHLNLEIIERYSKTVEQGKFMNQSTKTGLLEDSQKEIEVYYSLGNEIPVPNYMNMPISDLETWVYEQNKLGTKLTLVIHERFDDDVTYGNIISQSIHSLYTPIDSEINVLVSRGESYTVPDFTSYLKDSIQDICDANQVNVVFKYIASNQSSGTVLSQFPEAESEMSKDEFIIIEIAE